MQDDRFSYLKAYNYHDGTDSFIKQATGTRLKIQGVGSNGADVHIQSREDDDELNNILSKINHFETSIEAKVERKILSVLEGDCNTAAGIHANVIGNNVKIIAELFSDDGNKKFTYKDECKIEEALKIAVKAGNDLKKQFEME